jgi:OmpA-OmpF porin, OOP family
MTKRFNPPPARRASAVAIAAALAAFAGLASAQVVDSRGNPVRSTYSDCVRPGQGPAATGPCVPRVAAATTTAAAPAAASGSTAGASAQSAATGATEPIRPPGYAVASDGRVVLSGFGTCVRAGHWAPHNAAEPCDRIAVAQVEPPVPVVTPEPKLEPAPAPIVQAPPPQPAPLAAPEPPRPVIQRITLATDVLFEFDKAQLRDSGKSKLDEIAEATKDARVEEILVAGYADPIGSEQYNEKLSAARASAVREYLTQKGVSPERIKSEGRGETREFTEGQCDKLTGKKLIACFEPNRRVDVDLLGSRVVAGEAPAAGAGTTGSGSAPAGGGATTR